MSNRLTFSLASLTLIFALVFIAMPVMAAPGGPTVSITEYSGKDDYTTTATQPDHVQERTDFRLKVEFSIPVDGWDATDITVSGAASLTSSLTPYTSDVTVIPATDTHAGGAADVGKVYYVAINITTSDGNYEHSVISASIAADAVNGNIPTNRLGNEAKTQNFTSLPGATRYSITAKIDPADKVTLVASGDDKGKLTAADTFNVLFEYSGATGAYPTEIPTAQIQIKDKDGKDIANATTGVTATTAGSIASGNVSTAGLTVGAANVAAPIQVGVNPNWAGSASTFVWIPKAPGAPDPTITTQPTAEIEISSADGLTTMPRAFVIEVTFAPGEDSDGDPVNVTPGADFHMDVVKGKDSNDNAVSFTKIDSQMSENSYRGVLQYNTLSTPPLTITLARDADNNYKDTSDPTDDAMGMVGTTPGITPPPANAPAKPAAPMAATNATNDLIIDVSWTAPADNGSVITGYTVKKYNSAGMLVKTFPDDDPATTAITTTSYMVGPVPAVDRGMSFKFTVAATNANGTSAESDMSAPYMVPTAAPVGPTNNPPFFPTGESIADIVIWKGHAYTTPVLPKASDDEGDTLGDYTITPKLPDGLRLVANDVQDRTITGTATMSSEKTTYTFSVADSAGEIAKLLFDITVLDPIVPSAPTAVNAREEGDLGSAIANLDRTVNSNKVVVNWTAPVDTTKTSHVPAIPFGAPVTSYRVYQTDEDGSNPVTYPRPGATSIMKDASTYTTPAALEVGEYHFEVAAVNAVGTGATSTTEAGHNPVIVADPPGPADDLRASRVPTDPTSATLNWIEPDDNGGSPILGYFIFKTYAGRTVQAQLGNVSTHPWAGLEPGRHVFRVAAFNFDGLGERSESTEFSVDVPPGPSDNVAPTFGNETVDNITATVGMAITGRTLPAATDEDGDDGDLVYTLSPNPALIGLNFNPSTRFLAGTPSTVQGATTYTYTAMDPHGATDQLNFTIQVNPAPVGKAPLIIIPTVYDSSPYIPLGAQFTNSVIPAHGWAVLVRDVGGSRVFSPVGNTWIRSNNTSLPDLALFFGGRDGVNSGTVSLHKPAGSGAAADDIVISEIMWGVDNGNSVDPTCSQWIEFYNTTTQPIDLTGWKIRFHRSLVDESRWVLPDLVDIASNAGVTDRAPVHLYHEPWAPKGQSGVWGYNPSNIAQNIISMFLEINYTQAPNKKHAVPSGASGGAWSASVYPQSNLPFGIVGTPGSATIIRIQYAETPISQALIINEIGNSDNDAYDWVEIHNPGTAAVNIRSMMFTTVTNTGTAAAPVGKEEIIFKFPNADLNIQPGHYVVFAASDPENAGNDLAAGINILKSDIDQRNKGLGSKVGIGHQANNTTAFYRIHSAVRLPNDARHRLYILRKGSNDAAHDNRIGSHPDAQGNVVDVIGSLAIQLRNRTPAGWTGANEEERGRTDTGEARLRRIFDTTMWPLQWAVVDPGKKHPHGKRVDGKAEALGVRKVYHRNGKHLPNAENHLTTPGYSGVGYDRHAEVNAENHGTPGYANNSVKSEKSNWNMQVSISEIMLATHETEGARIPRATRLPQWIEIYNNSLTEGVNIGNWYLEIRNADSEDLITRDLHGTLRLPTVIIPPNQTVLIVSSSGLHSPNFPQQRVINLFTTPQARTVFSLQNRNDPVLSQVGFYIELRDHKGNHVDEIGNLPTTARRGVEARGVGNFDTVWDLPDMNHPDGPRTSLIRVYDGGKPNDGLMKVAELDVKVKGGDSDIGWRRAVDTTFRNVPTLTYYGNQRDYGTPGYRGGGPLPVSLSKFRPERLESGEVVIRWATESELNNAGFNILRSDTRDGQFTKVNTQLIAGQGTTSEKTSYEWKDTTAKPNVTYYYQIQDVSLGGQVQTLRQSRLKGNVTAAGKATTTWGKLKALQ